MGLSNLRAAMTKHPFVPGHVSALPLQSHKYAAVVDGYLIMHLKEPGAVFCTSTCKAGLLHKAPRQVFCGVTVHRCNRIRPFFDNGFLLVTPRMEESHIIYI